MLAELPELPIVRDGGIYYLTVSAFSSTPHSSLLALALRYLVTFVIIHTSLLTVE